MRMARGREHAPSRPAAQRRPGGRGGGRLLALFVLLSVMPLGLLTYSSIALSERAVRREVDNQLRATSDMSAAFLEQHMADLAELVESYAQRPSVIAALGDGNPANFNSAVIQLHMSQLQQSRAEIYGAFLTDVSGRLTDVVPPTPEIVGKDFSFRDWYKGITSTGRTYVSEAYETQIAGRPLVVAVGTHVRAPGVGGEPGRPLGILAVTYRLDALQRFAREVTGLRGAALSLTDQRGTVLAGPEGAPRGLVSRREDRAVAAALKGRSGHITEPGPSGDELVSYRPLQGMGWTATLRLPARTALAGIRSLRSTVLLVASVLGVALVAGFFLLARSDRRRRQAEAELEAARDQAMEGSRLKSEFVANMSHEVRTPINGVLGSAALLMDTSLDREQREYADMIRRSGESLLTVIDDILDFSKVEAGKLELEQVEFDLRPLVEDAAEMVSGRAHAKGLELACLIPASVPAALRGDPNRLRQVLLNLLSNAVKFTEKGEVVVRVAVAEQDEDHVELRFEVSDTGLGISEDEVDRLFEAFSQADTSTTRRYGGTGLGLAICSRLVQLMGGTMGVDSEPGRGSTFWFTARLEPAPPEAVGGLPSPRPHLEGLRVLVVDDNATNR
ncbi:MAG: ATP-binding protein, partial [Actinomycetota bacterium]|nr:ATP-binding protein [Actinomycetota bacterium]